MAVLIRITLALLVLVSAFAFHPPAYAADTAVDVKLTTSEIIGTGADAVLHLAGTVTNTGISTLYTVQVLTWSPKPWEPGASNTFSVTSKLSDLDLSATGVYLVGVHVRAAIDMSASYSTMGRARTFVTIGTPTARAATSSVVMLSSAPSY